MKIDVCKFTDPGGRERNEDSADYTVKNDSGFFILSDGLGGLKNGGKASEFTVKTLISDWNEKEEEAVPEVWLSANITRVNDLLVEEQEKDGCKMKSTLAALIIDGDEAVWANLGDSRLYYISEGGLRYITRDHSVAYIKYLSGEISYDQIRFDEDQASLLKTVGDKNGCSPDIVKGKKKLTDGDGFMLCSDGVWKYLYKNEILTDCLKSKTAEEWSRLLLLRIMGRIDEYSDNITFITIKIFDDEEKEG